MGRRRSLEEPPQYVTRELSDTDGGTELRLSHEQLPTETLRDGHNEGGRALSTSWKTCPQIIVDPIRKKMNTEEVAKKVVELVRKQAWYEAVDALYDENVVSVEAYPGAGGSPETKGKENVRKKIEWWVNAMEVHSFTANGPFVAHDRFVVQYNADITEKSAKERRQISEVGVYTVKDRKIVREKFLPRAG
jgi:SnoaL-like domain